MWYKNEISGNYVLQTTSGNIVIKGELLGDLPEEKMNAKCTAFYAKAEKDGLANANDEGTVFVGWSGNRKVAKDAFKEFTVDVKRQKAIAKVDIKFNITDME